MSSTGTFNISKCKDKFKWVILGLGYVVIRKPPWPVTDRYLSHHYINMKNKCLLLSKICFEFKCWRRHLSPVLQLDWLVSLSVEFDVFTAGGGWSPGQVDITLCYWDVDEDVDVDVAGYLSAIGQCQCQCQCECECECECVVPASPLQFPCVRAGLTGEPGLAGEQSGGTRPGRSRHYSSISDLLDSGDWLAATGIRKWPGHHVHQSVVQSVGTRPGQSDSLESGV